ncbi:MAG: LysR family transcriptional regulator [Thiobacillus sp. SCN 63-1177]|nr:MAG: LysR family transcriptional regulator [Thiobacillus sp. SCN 63-1177]
MLNLEHIASFLAVLRTRSFRAAAHERALSQATVSQHLQKLEAVLNTCLIERSHCGCSPTAAGKALLPHAESLMRVNARALSLSRQRTICIGASSNIGVYLLQPYVKSFLAKTGGQYPVEIVIHQNPTIADKLEGDEIDVAIMEWWDDRPGYIARPWRQEQLVVIVAPDHPWAKLPEVPRALLRDAPLLGGEPGTGTGRLLVQHMGAPAHGVKGAMQLGSTEAVKSSTVAEECRAGTLLAVPLEGAPISKTLYVIWRATLSPHSLPLRLAKWLLDYNTAAANTPQEAAPHILTAL